MVNLTIDRTNSDLEMLLAAVKSGQSLAGVDLYDRDLSGPTCAMLTSAVLV